MDETIYLSLDEITPLHGVTHPKHFHDLAADMEENGWKGRPLLVIERENDYLAWTGSHRLAAAREAGFPSVPCYVIQERKLLSKGFSAEEGHALDYQRLAILREVGDEMGIYLMRQEDMLH